MGKADEFSERKLGFLEAHRRFIMHKTCVFAINIKSANKFSLIRRFYLSIN